MTAATDIISDDKDKVFDYHNNLCLIPLEVLLKYYNIGFKIIPLGLDSKTPAISSTNEVYDNSDYWSIEKITTEHNKFRTTATTFGKVHVKGENGEALYLNGLDIDSDKVLGILFDFLEELKSRTFVTKTRKDSGYHVYWLSHKQNPPIGTVKCRPGYEFEIKTGNSLGLCTLPPSTHRNDSNFQYHCVGQEDSIVIDDALYDRLLDLLSNECLIQSDSKNKSNNSDENGRTKKSDSVNRMLEDDEIEQIVSYIKTSYQKGIRHALAFGLSGLLFKNKISLPCSSHIISLLCDFTHDEEKNSRLNVLSDTYYKGLDGQEIKGATQLQEILTRIHGTKIANEILVKLSQVLRTKDSPNKIDAHPSATQILVRLARQNTVLFFKDQYGVAYGRLKVAGHTEIVALESTKFEYYLSKLYYDLTAGEIVSQESLNNAKRVLIAETLFEAPTRELNLRVAWGEKKSDEIYYDLADSEWRCIRINDEGWQIVNSESAVLFTRFNQKPQVLPNRNYSNRIFDDFLDLMQIRDPGHRLLTKVWIVSLLIPEFPHPIDIMFGEKGGSKSTFCRFVKRLVDPDKIELLTTPQERAEFVQQLYHNYLAVYDNIKQLPPWFSDEVCKAITGVGSSKRRLYSDDEDIIYDYKRCLMISGINNSLTEPDALDRSILTQFDRIPDDQRKEESEVEAEFEEMRAKLFGCILDILVRALPIKPTIKLRNLPRMADFTVWSEAIARAMGHQPMEFVNVYYDNIGKQNVEAIESNPLAQAIEKFVCSFHKEGQEACWQSPTSKVLEKLNKVAQTHSIETSNEFWPKAANSLTKRLRPILSNLREGFGIHIVISRSTSGKNKNISTIKIWKQSPPPPPPPLGQNHAQNEQTIGGGSFESGDITSTRQEKSPPQTAEIHAQKLESGGGGDSGGFIPTSEGEDRLLHDSRLLDEQYLAFDFEWLIYDSEEKSIYAAAFVDNLGNNKVLHVSDLNGSELDLLDFIKNELLKYPLSIGWNTTGINSDLAILNERCVKSGIQSIVGFTDKALPFIEGQTHIDLYKVFRNEMVKTSIFKNRYRSLKLDEVSTALLGKGKIANTTGENVYTKSIEEQKEYVRRDSELVMGLSKINNGDVLSLMSVIGQLTGLTIEEVCQSSISTWWSKVFEEMGFAPPPSNNYHHINTKHNYEGGMVIEPKKGLYHNLKVVDVVSLYPSIAIIFNISFDTVNCECCSNRQDAKVPTEVIDKEYWICKQKEGAFPKKLKNFKAERIRQKQVGNIIKQQGLKILINGGYGLFGYQGFKYYDIRVAELITAYGRHALNRMQEIAKSNGLDIVGGDTDSLFLQPQHDSNILQFISECKEKLKVEVELDKTFAKAILTKKKHYVGITDNGNINVKGMEGMKNDRPTWINDVFNQVIKDILVDNMDPAINLRKSLKELEEGRIDPNQLKISVKISKDPNQYTVNNPQKKIGLLLNAKEGDIIQYYKSDNTEGVTLNPNDISVRKYKSMLWNTVKDVLEITDYDIVALERDLILNCINITDKIHRQQVSEVKTM